MKTISIESYEILKSVIYDFLDIDDRKALSSLNKIYCDLKGIKFEDIQPISNKMVLNTIFYILA